MLTLAHFCQRLTSLRVLTDRLHYRSTLAIGHFSMEIIQCRPLAFGLGPLHIFYKPIGMHWAPSNTARTRLRLGISEGCKTKDSDLNACIQGDRATKV
jgi:hypothetical protein